MNGRELYSWWVIASLIAAMITLAGVGLYFALRPPKDIPPLPPPRDPPVDLTPKPPKGRK